MGFRAGPEMHRGLSADARGSAWRHGTDGQLALEASRSDRLGWGTQGVDVQFEAATSFPLNSTAKGSQFFPCLSFAHGQVVIILGTPLIFIARSSFTDVAVFRPGSCRSQKDKAPFCVQRTSHRICIAYIYIYIIYCMGTSWDWTIVVENNKFRRCLADPLHRK